MSNLPAFKQDLIASVVQRELEFSAKLLPLITNVSQFAVPGSRSISFPKLSSFVVNDRAFGAADTPQTLADTVDQILMDKNKICSYILDRKDSAQTTINEEVEYARRAASAHGRDMDEEIRAVFEAAGRTDWGAATGDITRDIILDMQRAAFDSEANEDELSLVVSNDQYQALLKIAEFTEHQIYGPNQAISAGQIGTVYGMPVVRRSNMPLQTYYMVGKEGCALGIQVAPQMDSDKAIEFGAGSTRHVMDILYGVDSLQRGLKNAGPTESALLFKDNN